MANKNIRSIDLLPEFFQTDKNSKFLSSTIDQLIQKPKLERIDGFVGSKLTPTFDGSKDIYIKESLPLRTNYQLEPALVVKDSDNSVTDVIGLDDLTNEISLHGGIVDNFDRLFRSEFYSYDPKIDFDKFINYQEYYWLPTGPQTILITGQPRNSTSTYTVVENETGTSFVFTPDNITEDPLITLFRGNTYNFDIQSNSNFYIKTVPSPGTNDQYNINVTNNGISSGTVTIVINEFTPNVLYYISGDNVVAQGQFVIKDVDEDSAIDVETEILGKKNYTSGTGIKLSNGMKVQFGGTVYPESYRDKEYFVEGVGKSIRLIDYNLLSSPEGMADLYNDNFDGSSFDDFPFDSFKSLPIDPEYITINRASLDLNPWSRYNRWVHKDIIEISAELNNTNPIYPLNARAKRPIIEFVADLKLFNFGSYGLPNVDLIDNSTIDAFNDVEGSAGYYVDGVLLQQGHRVIFNADTDELVRGKVYTVNYVTIDGDLKLELVPDVNYQLKKFSAVVINLGNSYTGTNWWFNGSSWQFSQQHTKLNESPLFDLFDNQGNSFSDTDYYLSNFKGNKIFGYEIGSGILDKVLGFSVKVKNGNPLGLGGYQFKNYFMTDEIVTSQENKTTETIPTSQTYFKLVSENSSVYSNVWTPTNSYVIPIQQFEYVSQPTSTIKINSVDQLTNFSLEVFINNKKILPTEYEINLVSGKYQVDFDVEIKANTSALLKIYTNTAPNSNGFYEPPLGLTNNPLNGPISNFTLSDISDHLNSMINRTSKFIGSFPGTSNLRDIDNIASNGLRLISNANPLAFAQMFIGKKEHNIINAISKVADQYNQFKMAFLKKLSETAPSDSPAETLDQILMDLNKDKDQLSPYYNSDMVPYFTDKSVRTWTVTNPLNVLYPIANTFNSKQLNLQAVLVYVNEVQLVLDKDYEFVELGSFVNILSPLSTGDQIKIYEYPSTLGCFVPPTPSKLGLYPKFEPIIYSDNTFINGPVNVIQGHDGSITVAYNDYRDEIILELEKRIFNNIKSQYRQEILDLISILPSSFRTTEYTQTEINTILQKDFIKWAGFYGVDYETNSVFDQDNPLTWNYTGAYSSHLNLHVTGYWRSVYKSFYDTDRPHTHPWEMLGFTIKPKWWEEEYGPAPYTSGNEILWNDIELGLIRQGSRQGINSLYARPGLSAMLPVDGNGDLVSPDQLLIINVTVFGRRQSWKFGEHAPAETAWRRSSYWPFVVQKLLALTKPATYSALMYDPSRLQKNIAGQWTYGQDYNFLNLQKIVIPTTESLTDGYSVFVVETGTQRDSLYTKKLQNDITNLNFNLFYKVGGFISKNKMQIITDSYDPRSTNPGSLLPQENYELILNVSNPIRSVNLSGIVIQKVNGKFSIKGYDTSKPYFTVLTPIRNNSTPSITIGGISEPYLVWSESGTSGATGLNSFDTTTANSAATGKFYQQGQIVLFGNKFYRVKTSHNAESTFNPLYFQVMPSLPIKGGASVQIALTFSNKETNISYGTEFDTIQEVYDLIIGYGKWLETQGFIFDEFNNDLNTVVNWDFSSREFLYWTTQNWADNSVITLSPFSDQIKYQFKESVVDNVFNSFYEYSILQANGVPFPQKKLSVNRNDGLFTIKTLNSTDGIYFASLKSIQKEHAMVFDNTTIFNDVIYDIETGYRQRRIKLVGFRTGEWDGDYFSPGFVYDTAKISNWEKYKSYAVGEIVRYKGLYYSAIGNISGTEYFDFTQWSALNEKPVADLIPNFDYKINQFEDFYSLDIDNFDDAQQKMAQHLIGYTPRVYLNNVFTNPVAQYKFYQGFIKEKGTRKAIEKLAKASIHNLQGELKYTEEWAFRIGNYGGFETYREIEVPLVEGTFIENPQIINFVTSKPNPSPNDLAIYSTPDLFTIKPNDYVPETTFEIDDESSNDFRLTTAGFVRLDDVLATAYNENSLLDIANNRLLNDGDLIWLGFKSNGDWDVLRYSLQESRITGVFVSAPTENITFVTDKFHNLSVGDIVSVSQFNSQVNGVYTVQFIGKNNQFTVASDLASITNEDLLSPGLLFKFNSQRYNTFDTLPVDQQLIKLPIGSKFWVNNNGSEKWVVYQKTQNYENNSSITSVSTNFSQLGYNIFKNPNSDLIFVATPNTNSNDGYGQVNIYKKLASAFQLQTKYAFNDQLVDYQTTGTITNFGNSIIYDTYNFNDTGYGLIFTGAPLASNVKGTGSAGTVRYSTGTETPSSLVQQGAIKISSVDPITLKPQTEIVLLDPYAQNYKKFGNSIFVQRTVTEKIISTSTIDSKLLLVGAPGTATTGTGTVSAYSVHVSPTFAVTTTNIGITLFPHNTLTTGSLWGHLIVGSEDASNIAISAPGYSNNTGIVEIYSGTTYVQTLTSPFNIGEKFGEAMSMSTDGLDLFVSAPIARDNNQSYGKVAVYSKLTSTGTYTLSQIITNPIAGIGLKFGVSLAINKQKNELVISAVGNNNFVSAVFDSNKTTFDSKATTFVDSSTESGSVYVYNRKFNRFVVAEELLPGLPLENSRYGYSVITDNNIVYVGSPSTTDNLSASGVYEFTRINENNLSWIELRQQEDLVNTELVQRVSLIDNFDESVKGYLDVIDPIKGKIAGLAEQELKYKSTFDPAIYSIGVAGTVNDTNSNWLDDHIGELWWDLSNVKYMWYEQGELSFRKQTWGKLFPGSTIDVYEWVGSEYLPSEWSTLADTPEGLTLGISGQPKFADNSVISVKQIFNSVTNSFTNYYFYWVKNKVTVPDVKNRRISSYQVSSIIADPTAYGLQYAAILSKNAVALANISSMLVDNRILLNISSDSINNQIPRHTEWLLMQENSESSMPNILLEKKLVDSLLGHDKLGNPVPDPSLSSRVRYGLGIRPQQTLFKDRFEALRNLIEFTNSILITNRITDFCDLTTLKTEEQIPNIGLGEYDQIVEDIESLNPEIIETEKLRTAQLRCTISNGKIRNVIIDDSGYGYITPPTISIISTNGKNAKLKTAIDSHGQITKVIVENSGTGYSEVPTLKVRPYTVIVKSDPLFVGKWSKFIFDSETNIWIRNSTQKYNTNLYWKYVDWVSNSYNPYVDFVATVNDLYEINKVILNPGDYIKVKNAGDGRFVILEKVPTNTIGNFSAEFNIVYSQNGTIQILESVYDAKLSNYGFDQNNTFDQTLYDQTPDLELEYILLALKKDLFVADLKIYWNVFFFKAVKYALSEQKLLDWAFKTSFIKVVNNAGTLDQRPVYKLQDSSYYEDYLKEVKPYHTNIRSFTTKYDILEPTNTFNTDFDLPSYYDQETGMFTSIDIGNEMLSKHPWKSWADNYLSNIGSISVGFGGSGYTIPPAVQITAAPGDFGSGATAKAYIRSGQVVAVEVTNPGSGYKIPPVITFIGGGATDLIPARAYAQLENNKVRVNKIGMKFDRINNASQIGDREVVDRFIANGFTSEFVLNWLAEPDKYATSVTINGSTVLSSDFTIKYYKEPYGDYDKKYSKIVFLNFIPLADQVIKVRYRKNIELYNAAERIINFYTATSGMPGSELPQLMYGIEYPKTRFETLKFDFTNKWDAEYVVDGNQTWVSKFGEFSYADDVNFYTMTTVTTTGTIGTNSVSLGSVTELSVGKYANIISTLTNKFATGTNVVITAINTTTKTVTFNNTFTQTVLVGDVIEFWSYDSNVSILDSVVEGGSWSTSTSSLLLGALGINPEDIIIDGDNFFTPNTSYTPEELVSGEIAESIGINVYTKNSQGAPIVFSGNVYVQAGVEYTRGSLMIPPPTKDSIVAVFDGRMLDYVSTVDDFTDWYQFTIDWETNEIVVPEQTVTGQLGYTIVSIGGGREVEVGLIDTNSVTVEDQPTAQVQSLASTASVKSAFVTVDGVSINQITTVTDYGYMLSFANNDNRRAAVNVYNLSLDKHTVRAWFFANYYKYYNEVREEKFTITSPSQVTFTLTYPPGNIKPSAAQAIVEIDQGAGRRRLLPPYIDYYDVENVNNRTFAINSPGSGFSISNVKAYVNGYELRPGFDYSVSGTTVTIRDTILSVRDVVAIMALPSPAPDPFYEYNIVDNLLILSTGFNSGTLRVVTYTDHDDMLIRTERFDGNPIKRYKMSRPIVNENYIWVTVNGVALTSKLDYEVLDDQVTIQISDAYTHSSTDKIVITSVSSDELATNVLGYRIFNDMFNRTHFKRLSRKHSTYLTKELLFTDTEIHVADATALTPPNLTKKIPGVILIHGERIEFFQIRGNVLTQLRRSTLGTSPSVFNDVNTKVIDQSFYQSVPYSETTKKQVHITDATQTVYTISTVSTQTSVLYGDGIVLQANPVDSSHSMNFTDQVLVYYGGRLLNKAGTFYHDTTISYDSNLVTNISTATLSDTVLLPDRSLAVDLGTAYIITSTNQVWVYTNSSEPDAVKGFVYRGLNYQEPEFTVNTSSQIVLNIKNGVQDGIRLSIVKKEFTRNSMWNTEITNSSTVSILESTTVPAKFLQAYPADLPDVYYYGGDNQLISDNGFALTDNDDEPLEGL